MEGGIAMTYRRLVCVIALGAVLCAGCSWTRVRPIQSYEDRRTTGFRFYATKPYLLVTNEAVQVVYLPDYTRGYAVRWGSILSKARLSIQLQDGVTLKESQSTVDATSIFGALRDMFKEAGTEALARAAAAPPRASGKFEGLYEIVYDEKTGVLKGLRKVADAPALSS
jgi:hypothetical protein